MLRVALNELILLLPAIVAGFFLGCVALGAIALCVFRVRSDDLSDGVPGDVPQVIVTAAVVIVLVMAALNQPGALSILEKSAGALAAVIPLSLSPWLIYKGYKSKVAPDGAADLEVTKE
jgi:hypothetical protein